MNVPGIQEDKSLYVFQTPPDGHSILCKLADVEFEH